MSATRTTPVVEKATGAQKGKRTKQMEDTTMPEPEPKPTPESAPLSGYATTIVLFATRYKQGGRVVYSLDLSLDQIDALITPPNPDVPTPGNRAIRPAHAKGFAKYIREREDWVSPGLLLRTPNTFDFEVREEVAGIQFGLLTMSRRSLADLHVIDGQHRILGVMWGYKGFADDLDRARSNLANARRTDKGGAAEKEARARIAELEKRREQLANERVNVQVHVENDPTKYKQMFVDIADNALGITASVKSRFDSRKVVHRALAPTMEHPLLLGRVDPEGDRLGRGSQFMFGAKHVAEIIRTVTVGLDGRVSRRQEAELNEQDLAATAKDFFTMLTEAFPQEQAISLGQLLPSRLRETSLLGSVLFVRILAGVYYDLINLHAFERADVKAFFEKLAPHVSGPVYDGSIWTTNVNDGIFSAGGMAPRGRRQDLKFLKNAIGGWALDKPKFLDEPPAPRPEEIVEEVSTEEEMRVVDEILARKR